VPRAKANKAKAAKPKRAPETAVELPATTDEQALVDRYYAMAEELNGRGSMELAVPFYRQTIALLLAEREQLRALAGDASVALQPSADVDGVMAAAASLEAALPADLLETDLLRQLMALEEELSEHNQLEVAAALKSLQEQWGQPHPQLLALQAKLQLLAGELLKARAFFEQALELDASCARLRLNTGAARLAMGDVEAALDLLRPLSAEMDALEACGGAASYWNNLARAELAADNVGRATAPLRQWLTHVPPATDCLEPWLEEAQALRQSGRAETAMRLLQVLADAGTPDQRRVVLPELAELLEASGSFREAALLYRELLRPGLAA
jgi:tetratricopeptide (TPR) repeat protein